MIAKAPDYIIAECGCPHWAPNGKTCENFALFKGLEIIGDTNKRLLPLRETLTDYYARTVASKLEAWKEAKSNARKHKEAQQNNRLHDPAKVKQLKTQRNEAIKQQQTYNTRSSPNILDKSRHNSRSRSTTTPDNDLDVF